MELWYIEISHLLYTLTSMPHIDVYPIVFDSFISKLLTLH